MLIPSTPLTFVSTGAETLDAKRVSMLLEQQLEEVEEYKKTTGDGAAPCNQATCAFARSQHFELS